MTCAPPPPHRILFVDDEVHVLKALERLLHPMRREWAMTFVSGGVAALEALSRHPFDVVVTDMRMPGMSGLALLEQIAQLHPGTIRMVLSGQSDRDTLVETATCTHQYLAKPCDADELKSRIREALARKGTLGDDPLRRFLTEIRTLPSLPSVYLDIMQELQRPDPSTAAIGDIVARDVGMLAKVLQLVNSAYFGIYRTITSGREAVQYLGVDIIRSMALSVHIFAACRGADGRLDVAALWAHSVLASRIARRLARLEGLDTPAADCAASAALLHDCGKLLLGLAPRHWLDAHPEPADPPDGPAWMAERDRLGFTHADVGAYLLGTWGLPEAIVTPVAAHHEPYRVDGPDARATLLVHAASAFAHDSEGTGDGRHVIEIDDDVLAAAGFGLTLQRWRDESGQVGSGGGA